MEDLEVKNQRKLQPPRSRKVDYERDDREKKLKVIPKSPRKQPRWIRQQEED